MKGGGWGGSRKETSCGNLWSSFPSFFSEETLLCFYSSHFYCQNDENQPCEKVAEDSRGPVEGIAWLSSENLQQPFVFRGFLQ